MKEINKINDIKTDEVETDEVETENEDKLAKCFPRDQIKDFPFSNKNVKNFINPKFPVLTEKTFKDTDQEGSGLRIRAYPSGLAVYFVLRRIRSEKGGAKKRKICNVGEKTLADARKEARKFIEWMSDGKDPFHELKKELEKNKVYTVRDSYNLYMKSRTIQDNTRERYERVFDVLSYVHIYKNQSWKDISSTFQIKNTFTNKSRERNKRVKFFTKLNIPNLKSLVDADLNEISSESILFIHKSITESHGYKENKAGTEADRAIQFLGSLYDIAIDVFNEKQDDNSFIKRNPVKIMSRGKGHWNNPGGKAKRRDESLDTDHVKVHYNAIMKLRTLKNKPSEDNPNLKYTNKPIPGAVRAHYFLRFMFWTGWRPSDVARIQWNQIETSNKNGEELTTISWDDEEAIKGLKNGEPIYKVPINHQAAKVINELKEYKENKLFLAEKGEIQLRKDFDNEHVFLNVLENGHIKPNQHSYEVIVARLAGTSHYPTSIYRKTFLTYGNELELNIYTLKRLVFHTQNYFDVTSGYIHTKRKILLDTSELVASYLLSFIESREFVAASKNNNTSIELDQELIDELEHQYGEQAASKCNDLIRIALAAKVLNPSIFKQLENTTTENAKFKDSDFE